MTGVAGRSDGAPGSSITISAAAELAALGGPFWPRILGHPFVAAAAAGSLPDAVFDRWLGEDHTYVMGFRRFLAGLVALSPDETAGDVLGEALASLRDELALFRTFAADRGVELGAEPAPTTLAYVSYLHSSLLDGYPVALSVLYAAEKAYYDAWSAVRTRAETSSPIWSFIDNWSSPAFGRWVDDLARLVDAAAPLGATVPMRRGFERAARYELRFWNAIHAGEQW